MKQKTVRFFSDNEEKFIDTLIAIGFRKQVAVLLVFLRRTKETTLLQIEQGIDLQYSAISMGMKYLVERGWVRVRENGSPKGGRATNIYSLALPLSKILDIVEKEKKEEMKRQFIILRSMKENSR